MGNILVLGVGPLPHEPTDRLHAPGIRTWQFASALANKHHFITLCIIDFGDFQAGKNTAHSTAVREDLGQNINLVRLSYHPRETANAIRTLHVATKFHAIVSSSDIMNALAVDLDVDCPLWLDYNGDPFAEKQLQALTYSHDGSLLPQWELYLKGLLRGDRFSVCSRPQKWAMIGQLGVAGRLTAANSGEELVQVLPNCSRVMAERQRARVPVLKGLQIPAGSFLVLWTGGYNTWCDPQMLFNGLELAMRRNENIFFATTGGTLEGHDTKSFEQFKTLVEQSALRERFIFLGWVPTEQVPSYYELADLAVFVDRPSVEGELGTRTRLVDWLQFRVPILCTPLCEFARELEAEGLIATCPMNDAEEFVRRLQELAESPQAAKARAEKAARWFDEHYGEQDMLRPLLEWVERPVRARDAGRRSRIADIQLNAVSRKDAGRVSATAAGDGSAAGGLRGTFKKLFGRK